MAAVSLIIAILTPIAFLIYASLDLFFIKSRKGKFYLFSLGLLSAVFLVLFEHIVRIKT